MKLKMLSLIGLILFGCSLNLQESESESKRVSKIECIRNEIIPGYEGQYSLIEYDSKGNTVSINSFLKNGVLESSLNNTYDTDNKLTLESSKLYTMSFKTEYFYTSDNKLDYKLNFEDDILTEKYVYFYNNDNIGEIRVYTDLNSNDLEKTYQYNYDGDKINRIDVTYSYSSYLDYSIEIFYDKDKIVKIIDDDITYDYLYTNDKLTKISERYDDELTVNELKYSNDLLVGVTTTIDSSYISGVFENKYHYENGPITSPVTPEEMYISSVIDF